MDCFNSSDPAAANATLLYDFRADNESLWKRSEDNPLPPCSSSSSPNASSCLVCKDHMVYAVCRHLADGVKMIMEAGERQVEISKSDCPKLASAGDPQQQISIILIILLAIFLLVVGLILAYKRYCRNKKAVNGEEIQEHQVEESFL